MESQERLDQLSDDCLMRKIHMFQKAIANPDQGDYGLSRLFDTRDRHLGELARRKLTDSLGAFALYEKWAEQL